MSKENDVRGPAVEVLRGRYKGKVGTVVLKRDDGKVLVKFAHNWTLYCFSPSSLRVLDALETIMRWTPDEA